MSTPSKLTKSERTKPQRRLVSQAKKSRKVRPNVHPATGQILSPVVRSPLVARKKSGKKGNRRKSSVTIAPSTRSGPDVRINRAG